MNYAKEVRLIADKHYEPDTRHIGFDDWSALHAVAARLDYLERVHKEVFTALRSIHRLAIEEA